MLDHNKTYNFYFADDEHDVADLLAQRTKTKKSSVNASKYAQDILKTCQQMTNLRNRLPAIKCKLSQFLSPKVDFIVHTKTLPPSTAATSSHSLLSLSSSSNQSKASLLLHGNNTNNGNGNNNDPQIQQQSLSSQPKKQQLSRTSSRSQRMLGSAPKKSFHSFTSSTISNVLLQDVLSYVQLREELIQQEKSSERLASSYISSYVPQGTSMENRIVGGASAAASGSNNSQKNNPTNQNNQNNQRYQNQHQNKERIANNTFQNARIPPRLVIGDQQGRPIQDLEATFANDRVTYSKKSRKRSRSSTNATVSNLNNTMNMNMDDDVIIKGRLSNLNSKRTNQKSKKILKSKTSPPVPRLDRTLLNGTVATARPIRMRSNPTVSAPHALLRNTKETQKHQNIQAAIPGTYLYPMLESKEPVFKIPIERTSNSNFTPRILLSNKPTAGYCFCCHLQYSNLDDHVLSRQHVNYYQNNNNFMELENFLQSVYSVKILKKEEEKKEEKKEKKEKKKEMIETEMEIEEKQKAKKLSVLNVDEIGGDFSASGTKGSNRSSSSSSTSSSQSSSSKSSSILKSEGKLLIKKIRMDPHTQKKAQQFVQKVAGLKLETNTKGEFRCPHIDCGRTFTSEFGLGSHIDWCQKKPSNSNINVKKSNKKKKKKKSTSKSSTKNISKSSQKMSKKSITASASSSSSTSSSFSSKKKEKNKRNSNLICAFCQGPHTASDCPTLEEFAGEEPRCQCHVCLVRVVISYEEFKAEYLRQREKKGLTGNGTNLARDWSCCGQNQIHQPKQPKQPKLSTSAQKKISDEKKIHQPKLSTSAQKKKIRLEKLRVCLKKEVGVVLPRGWTVTLVKRTSGQTGVKQTDAFWISPTGTKYNSIKKVCQQFHSKNTATKSTTSTKSTKSTKSKIKKKNKIQKSVVKSPIVKKETKLTGAVVVNRKRGRTPGTQKKTIRKETTRGGVKKKKTKNKTKSAEKNKHKVDQKESFGRAAKRQKTTSVASSSSSSPLSMDCFLSAEECRDREMEAMAKTRKKMNVNKKQPTSRINTNKMSIRKRKRKVPEDVQKLIDMGFPHDQCVVALKQGKGDYAQAMVFLFGE